MVKHGDPTRAYMMAYPKAKQNSARVKSYNLLQNVTISDAIKEKSDRIVTKAEEEAAEELKDKIVEETLTREEKRAILRKIALGEHDAVKVVFLKGEAKTIKCKPTHAEIMEAIDLDNKMTGDNAPIKTENKGTIEVEIS